MKRIVAFLLAAVIFILPLGAVDLYTKLADASPSLMPASIGGDWTVVTLARADKLEKSLADTYYLNAVEYVTALDGVLHQSRYTEYSRMILALGAIGRDPRDVGGYDLVKPLGDFDAVIKQGMNGAAWALIALDSNGYQISYPTGVKTRTTRDKLIEHILGYQQADGSFDGLDGSEVEYTAMALLALANYSDRDDVSDAIDRGVEYLSGAQGESGGFPSRWGESSEVTSYVIIALSKLGIDPDDERFTKDNSLYDNLESYRAGDGYAHVKSQLEYNRMATEQALLALAAVDRMQSGKNLLFDYSDVTPDTSEPSTTQGLSGKNPAVKVPSISGTVEFGDIGGENSHECLTAAEALASRGILTGYEDGSFRPDNSLTRAEFAAIIVRALGLTSGGKSSGFVDVPNDAWYAEYVAAAVRYGLIEGVGSNRYDPDGRITREAAAVVVARAAKLCGFDTTRDSVAIRNTLSPFADYIKSSSWARESLAFCCDEGILDANALNLRPLDPVLRGETAMMIYALLSGAKLI